MISHCVHCLKKVKKKSVILFWVIIFGLVALFGACLWIPIRMILPDATIVQSVLETSKRAEYQTPKNYTDHKLQQQKFKTQDGAIAYTDHGTGPVLLMIHGVPTSSWMYRDLIAGLQTDFRVITVDLLGYGSSDKPAEDASVYETKAQAARILSLMDHLGIGTWTQLCHDMGGLVTWEMLDQLPEKISGLAVLNTITTKEGFNYPAVLSSSSVIAKNYAQFYENPLMAETVMQMTLNNGGLRMADISSEKLYGYVYPMREGGQPAIAHFFGGFNDDFFSDLTAKKSVFNKYPGKILILWGTQDSILTVSQADFLVENFMVKPTVILRDDLSHFLMEQDPAFVVEQVKKVFGE
jgi:haloalkane dehalogenase